MKLIPKKAGHPGSRKDVCSQDSKACLAIGPTVDGGNLATPKVPGP